MAPAEEEQLDPRLKMNVGNVASVDIGPTSANLVVAVAVMVMEAEGEVAQEDAEADHRKWQLYMSFGINLKQNYL